MNILFVSSGTAKTETGISPIIKAQGDSLSERGHTVLYFAVKEGGIKGYLSAVKPLHSFIKNNKPDVIHAHYSLSAFCATLANFGLGYPIVVSLMGDDVLSSKGSRILALILNKLAWKNLIVKSAQMGTRLGLKSVNVIPNGVNTNRFRPMERNEARNSLGLDIDAIYLLFPSDPDRHEKNYPFFEQVLNHLIERGVAVKSLVLKDINHLDIPLYMNSVNVMLLTSKWEGSPNVIKEAMACNCPIVTTNVGDAAWVIGDTEGCFVSSFDPQEFSAKIKQALHFSEVQGQTNGRKRILQLGLDAPSVAQRIIKIYQSLVE